MVRPLDKRDDVRLHKFFLAVPEEERLFIKQPIFDRTMFKDWCRHADFERNLPLLMLHRQKVIGEATLHQRFGGWKPPRSPLRRRAITLNWPSRWRWQYLEFTQARPLRR